MINHPLIGFFSAAILICTGRHNGGVLRAVVCFMVMAVPVAIVLSTGGCASQAPPQGGPEDKTPPVILFTEPASDSVRVPRDPAITVTFSEPMNKASLEQSVFISPRPAKPVSFRWKKNTLNIILPDNLDSSRTCVITIGVGAKDARQNPMQKPYTFAFSTGDRIDRGQISGRVFHANYTGLEIWAYHTGKHKGTSADSLIFKYPADYVTSVDERGQFKLSYLADGVYRVFAVADQDRDFLYTPGIDLIGVPHGDHTLSGDSNDVSGMVFHIMKEDTIPFRIESLRATDEQTLLVALSKPLGLQYRDGGGRLLNRFVLTGLTTNDLVPVDDIYLNTVHFTEVILTTGKLDSALRYRLTADTLISESGDTLFAADDTLRLFEFYPPEPPAFEWILPEKGPTAILPNDRIGIRFSKSMNRESFEKNTVLMKDSAETRKGQWQWIYGGYAEYVHDTLFVSGADYQLAIPPKSVTDLQNLPLSDTTVRFEFQAYPADSLGVITGVMTLDSSWNAFPCFLILRNLTESKRNYTVNSRGGTAFQFDFVAPGKYILESFVDRNRDGRFNKGKPAPFEPPEPYRLHPDTLSVRANWETAGIEFIFK